MQLTSSGNLSAASFEEGANLISPEIVDYGVLPVPNLVTNGLAELESNENFGDFGACLYYTDDYLTPPGCFRVPGVQNVYTTEDIEINKDESYRLKGAFKSIGPDGESKIYFGIMTLDENGLIIGHYHVHYYETTKTILTADLNNGDSVAYLRDTSSWNASGEAWWFRYMGMWGSMSDYPDYTYTRNIPRYDSRDTVANTVTLYEQWAGVTVPSGTAVANMYSGGTYQYIGSNNEFIPSGSWTEKESNDTGISTWNNYGAEVDAGIYFRYGTKYIRLIILGNHDQSSGYELLMDRFLWYNITRSQSLPVTFNINSNDKVNCNEFVEGHTDGATLRMREEKYADMADVDNYRIKIKGELCEIGAS